MKKPDFELELTRYLDGELSTEARGEFERKLESDPELAARRDELAMLVSGLGEAFAGEESVPALEPERRRAILARASRAGGERTTMSPWAMTLCLAAAAAVVVGTFLPFIDRLTRPFERRDGFEYTVLRPGAKPIDPDADEIWIGESFATRGPGRPGAEDLPAVAIYPDTLDIVEAATPDQPLPGLPLLRELKYWRGRAEQPLSPDAVPAISARDDSAAASSSFLDRAFLAVAEYPLVALPLRHESTALRILENSLGEGRLPRPGTLAVEELLNALDYGYPGPEAGEALNIGLDVHVCPWNSSHLLARLWIKGAAAGQEAGGTTVGPVAAEWGRATLEFNPAAIQAFRYVGSSKPAANDGALPRLPVRIPLPAGCEITILCELVPAGIPASEFAVARRGTPPVFEPLDNAETGGETVHFTLTYRIPGSPSAMTRSVSADALVHPFASASDSFKRAAALAVLGGAVEAGRADAGWWNLAVELAYAGSADGGTEADMLPVLARKARAAALGMRGPVAPPPGAKKPRK